MNYPTTISECHKLLDKQAGEIAHLNKQILHLDGMLLEVIEEMYKLKDRLGKNSSNSHNAPSTDHFFKKSVKVEPSTKPKGGQTGHIGNTLKMVETPDEVVQHLPKVCSCGQDLAGVMGESTQKRQLFDLPVIRFQVTEHQILQCNCPSCGKQNVGTFPLNITAPTQYGNRTKAFSVLLNNQCQVSFRKIGMVFQNIAGQSINQTTLQSANNEAYSALEAIENQNKKDLQASEVVRADESGLRVEANIAFLHTVADEKTTHLWASKHRGTKAHTPEQSPLLDFENTLMHDRLPLYEQFNKANHLYCNAHLMRDLQALAEKEYPWAIRLIRAYKQLYRISKETPIPQRFKARIDKWFDNIIAQALTKEPPPKPNAKNGKLSRTEARNLLEFFQKNREKVLAFAFDKAMPFSNNLAEQALRHAKTKMKVIGSFRLMDGAKTYARCQAVFDTWRKRGQSTYQNLKLALDTWQNTPKFA